MNNNIFLAKIVTFDNYALLFEINNLEPASEEFKLIAVYGKWAYDLQTKRRYYILDVHNNIIANEDLDIIRMNGKYVYEKYSFDDIWDSIKEVFNINEDKEGYLSKCIEDIEELNKILTSGEKIIDLNKIKKLRKEKI